MFDALFIHRLAHRFYLYGIPLIPLFLQGVIFILFNSYVPYQLQIGKKSRFGHRGIGLVINKDSIIGENVLIRSHVTIGKKINHGGAPVIGNNVEIGDGAKIIGDIIIGNNVIIGANAVVLKDVPSGSIAVGVPARLITRSSISND